MQRGKMASLNTLCPVLTHKGVGLVATNVKDFKMMLLYDDRALGVVPNTGVLLHELSNDNGYTSGYSCGKQDGYSECLSRYGDV